MRKLFTIIFGLLYFGIFAQSGNVGIGQSTPVSKLDINGNTTIGSTYSGTNVAPTNGLRVEGHTVINKASAEEPNIILQTHAASGDTALGAYSVDKPAAYFRTSGNSPTLRSYNSNTACVDVAIISNATTNTDASGSDVLFCNNLGTGTGSGYGGAAGRFSILGQVTAGSYCFGVSGSVPGGTGIRFGGTMGCMTGSGYPSGMLAYKSSGSIYYSYYGIPNGNTNTGTGTGKLAYSKLPTAHFGIGAYGGFAGGWIKGEVWGLMAKGNDFSLYVDGKTYTNDAIVQLNTSTNEDARIPTYVPTSASADIYLHGVSTLTNGTAVVKLDSKILNLIDVNSIVITVTPIGDSKGIYIAKQEKDGFTVRENSNGQSSVKFNWIAIATRKDFSTEISKDLAKKDFDSYINGVMNNDGDLNSTGNPIWYDGQNVRYEKVPDDLSGDGGASAQDMLKKDVTSSPSKAKNSPK